MKAFFALSFMLLVLVLLHRYYSQSIRPHSDHTVKSLSPVAARPVVKSRKPKKKAPAFVAVLRQRLAAEKRARKALLRVEHAVRTLEGQRRSWEIRLRGLAGPHYGWRAGQTIGSLNDGTQRRRHAFFQRVES